MKRSRTISAWLMAMSGAAMVSLPVLGQVATPPPAAPPTTPEYVPPPSPPPAPPRPRPTPIDRNLPGGGPMQDQAPSIPFKPLGRDDKGELIRDEKGNMRPLPLPMEVMALDRNPTVGDVTMYRLKPYLRERKAAVEKTTIDNLDMIQQIDGGVIDRLDIKKKEQLIALTEMLRPLVAQGPLATDLRKRDLLTKMQTAMNQKITKQYQTDLITEVKTKAKEAGQEEAPEVTKVLLYNSVDEVMYAYRSLLLETGKRLLSTDAKHTEQELMAAGRKHLEPLKLEERQAELRKTVELRPPPPPDGPPPKDSKDKIRILNEEELRAKGYTPEKIKEMKEKRKQGQPSPEDEEAIPHAPEQTAPAPAAAPK